jgi:hypothetical protein
VTFDLVYSQHEFTRVVVAFLLESTAVLLELVVAGMRVLLEQVGQAGALMLEQDALAVLLDLTVATEEISLNESLTGVAHYEY